MLDTDKLFRKEFEWQWTLLCSATCILIASVLVENNFSVSIKRLSVGNKDNIPRTHKMKLENYEFKAV